MGTMARRAEGAGARSRARTGSVSFDRRFAGAHRMTAWEIDHAIWKATRTRTSRRDRQFDPVGRSASRLAERGLTPASPTRKTESSNMRCPLMTPFPQLMGGLPSILVAIVGLRPSVGHGRG